MGLAQILSNLYHLFPSSSLTPQVLSLKYCTPLVCLLAFPLCLPSLLSLYCPSLLPLFTASLPCFFVCLLILPLGLFALLGWFAFYARAIYVATHPAIEIKFCRCCNLGVSYGAILLATR